MANLHKLLTAMDSAAEAWAIACARSADSAGRNGIANTRKMEAEAKALARYEAAREALRNAISQRQLKPQLGERIDEFGMK